MEPTNINMAVNSAGPGEHGAGGIFSPDVSMVLLTWVTFFLLLAVLYQFAWKPILAQLESREDRIRRAVDDAKKAREELEKVHKESARILAAADEKAAAVIERSKSAALEAAKVIEHKAKEEAHILLTNATTEIKAMQEKALITLREESVRLAVRLAGKVIQEELSEHKEIQLTHKLIEELKVHE